MGGMFDYVWALGSLLAKGFTLGRFPPQRGGMRRELRK